MFKRVHEFHRIFDIYISDVPCLPNQWVRNLRRKLLWEELMEFCAAHKNNDLVNMADGLADMAYVLAGTCVSYGIMPEGDIESPYDSFKQLTIFRNMELDRVLREDVVRYDIAETNDDLATIKDELMTLMADIFGVSLHLGIPFNKVFAEVHRSNLSKVNEDGRPSYRESDGKLLKGSRYTPPNLRPILYPEEYPITRE